MHPSIVPFEDLQELCKPGHKPLRATVEAWAQREGIRYRYDGKGGIFTTIEAVNVALGLRAANDDAPADPSLFGPG